MQKTLDYLPITHIILSKVNGASFLSGDMVCHLLHNKRIIPFLLWVVSLSPISAVDNSVHYPTWPLGFLDSTLGLLLHLRAIELTISEGIECL